MTPTNASAARNSIGDAFGGERVVGGCVGGWVGGWVGGVGGMGWGCGVRVLAGQVAVCGAQLPEPLEGVV